MKATSTLFVSALLASLLLTACGEKAEEPAVTTEAPAEVAAPAPAAEPAPAPAPEAGGYTPTAEEKVPGITMTQEELDKLFAEARANTPVAIVPGEEAPAAAAAEAAPAEAAPAEAK